MGFSQKLLKEFPKEFPRNRLQNYEKKIQVIAKEISRRTLDGTVEDVYSKNVEGILKEMKKKYKLLKHP